MVISFLGLSQRLVLGYFPSPSIQRPCMFGASVTVIKDARALTKPSYTISLHLKLITFEKIIENKIERSTHCLLI